MSDTKPKPVVTQEHLELVRLAKQCISVAPEYMREWSEGFAEMLANRDVEFATRIKKEATLAEHKSHVDFESELYATLVDPIEDGTVKESEMRTQLLQSALWHRQHVQDLETQLNATRARAPSKPEASDAT